MKRHKAEEMSYPPRTLPLQYQYVKKRKTTREPLPANIKHHVLVNIQMPRDMVEMEGMEWAGQSDELRPNFEGAVGYCRRNRKAD